MKYDLSKQEEILEAKKYLEILIDNQAIAEVVRKTPRSHSQNNYLHILLQAVALELGEQVEYVKQELWKKEISSDIFKSTYVNPKTGAERLNWRSSADLSTSELTTAINKLINWASMQLHISLPHPEDYNSLRLLENQIEKNKEWV